MKIIVYTIAHNEEKLLPFFLDYYGAFCSEIIIFDNESTDRTVEIANAHPKVKEVINVPTEGLDDSMYVNTKNSCWKGADCDYVILVDVDEILYHKDLIDYLWRTRLPVYRPTGFNMISESFPETNTPITNISRGLYDDKYNKPIIFNPRVVDMVEFEMGIHNGVFYDKSGKIINFSNNELKLLHYKNLSFDYRFNRHVYFAKRMSEFNKATGAGVHYTYSKEQQQSEFTELLNNAEIII